MSGSPRVSAVVLNYNGAELLEIVLPSLAAQTYDGVEVVVVDNGSSDDSMRYLQEHWPAVRAVSTGPRNVGVAAALNVAVMSSRGELIALLNNDIELEPDWLEQLVAAIDRHPDAAAVAGKTLNYWRRDELDGAGDLFSSAATPLRRGLGELDQGQYDAEEEVFSATAGAALYRRDALEDVGAFDESFVAYLEDADWGLRAQLAGYRAWYVPSAVAYHMGGGTTGGDSSSFYYALLRRNTIAVLIKDVPARFIWRNARHIACHHIFGLIDSARRRRLGSHLRALAGVMRNGPGWLRARRSILQCRRIDLADFERRVSAGRGAAR